MTGPQTAAMTPVLQAISRELAVMGDMSLRLQTVFGSLRPTTVADITDAQLLDTLAQRLFALASFTAALAPGAAACSAASLGEALAAINLSDLARRLAGDGDDAAADTGVFECFGDVT